MSDYWLIIDGEQRGPMTRLQVREAAVQGALTATAQIRRGNMAPVPVTKVVGIAELIAAH